MSEPGSDKYEDYRTEYEMLFKSFISLGNMKWLGYGVFFTVNSILVAVLGFSMSQEIDVDIAGSNAFDLTIKAAGVFTAAIAIYSAMSLHAAQIAVVKRGVEIEKELYCRIVTIYGEIFHPQPYGTIVGAVFFGCLWVASFFLVG